MSDLWTEASYDAEADQMAMLVTSARVSAAPMWCFLAAAEGPRDFINRKAIVADRLDQIVSTLMVNDPIGFGVVRSSLEAGFDEDFKILANERRLEAQRVEAQREAHLARFEPKVAVADTICPYCDFMGSHAEVGAHIESSGPAHQANGSVTDQMNDRLNRGASKTAANALDLGTCATCGGKIVGIADKGVWEHIGGTPVHPDASVAGDAHGIKPLGEIQRGVVTPDNYQEHVGSRKATRKTAADHIECFNCAAYGSFACGESVGTCDLCGQNWDVFIDGDRDNPAETVCLNCLIGGKHLKNAHTPEGQKFIDGLGIKPVSATRKIAVERKVELDPESGQYVGSEWEESEDGTSLVQSASTFGNNPKFATEEEANGWAGESAETEDTSRADEEPKDEPAEPEEDGKKANPFAKKDASVHKTADAYQEAVRKGMMMGTSEYINPGAMLPSSVYIVMEPGPNGARKTDRKTTSREVANEWAKELLAREDWSPWTKASRTAANQSCVDCGGTGSISTPAESGSVDDGYSPCPTCGGTGLVTQASRHTAAWIDQARKVVQDKQHTEVDGVLLDMTTANLLVQIFDALAPANRDKFGAMSLEKAADVAWKIQGKTSAKTAADASEEYYLTSGMKGYGGEIVSGPHTYDEAKALLGTTEGATNLMQGSHPLLPDARTASRGRHPFAERVASTGAKCSDCFEAAEGYEPDMGDEHSTFEPGTCSNCGTDRGVVFTVTSSRRQAEANPYSTQGNPYIPAQPSPGTPDDLLDGPTNPSPVMLDVPMTTRPRQMPSGDSTPEGTPERIDQ